MISENKKYTAIIIEDEELARNMIKTFLKDHHNIKLLGEYGDGFEGVKAINKLNPEIVFLDVEMPKLSGFEMLELLQCNPAIVFTTAYDNYAVKAFEKNAADYLLKPYDKERFAVSINKAIAAVENKSGTHIKKEDQKDINKEEINNIVIKSGTKINVIPIEEIVRLEAQDDYVMIYTKTGKHLKQATLKTYESCLPKNDFYRIHRSHIVRLSEITALELYEKDSYIAILKDKTTLKISRSKIKSLKSILNF